MGNVPLCWWSGLIHNKNDAILAIHLELPDMSVDTIQLILQARKETAECDSYEECVTYIMDVLKKERYVFPDLCRKQFLRQQEIDKKQS